MAPVVNVSRLREIINDLIDHIEKDLRVTEVTIPVEKRYYWEISEDELRNMDKTPPVQEVGSLWDDWEFIQQLDRNHSNLTVLSLSQVAPILQFFAEALPPYKGA